MKRRPRSSQESKERWLCGQCGAEDCRIHPREDRVSVSSLGPRPWDSFFDFGQPARRCACGHAELGHLRNERYEEAVLARAAQRWESIPDLLLPCTAVGCRCPAFRCKECDRGPCRCKSTAKGIAWARAKKRLTIKRRSEVLAAQAARAGKDWARLLAAAAHSEADEAAEEEE